MQLRAEPNCCYLFLSTFVKVLLRAYMLRGCLGPHQKGVWLLATIKTFDFFFLITIINSLQFLPKAQLWYKKEFKERNVEQLSPSSYKYHYMSIICWPPAVHPASILPPIATLWACLSGVKHCLTSSLHIMKVLNKLHSDPVVEVHIFLHAFNNSHSVCSRLIFQSSIHFCFLMLDNKSHLRASMCFLLKCSTATWANTAGKDEQRDPGEDTNGCLFTWPSIPHRCALTTSTILYKDINLLTWKNN